MSTSPGSDGDLAGRLVEFVGALRTKGVPAGTSETVDAAAVMEVLGLDRRELLREGLASALVRRGGQRDGESVAHYSPPVGANTVLSQ